MVHVPRCGSDPHSNGKNTLDVCGTVAVLYILRMAYEVMSAYRCYFLKSKNNNNNRASGKTVHLIEDSRHAAYRILDIGSCPPVKILVESTGGLKPVYKTKRLKTRRLRTGVGRTHGQTGASVRPGKFQWNAKRLQYLADRSSSCQLYAIFEKIRMRKSKGKPLAQGKRPVNCCLHAFQAKWLRMMMVKMKTWQRMIKCTGIVCLCGSCTVSSRHAGSPARTARPARSPRTPRLLRPPRPHDTLARRIA